jgi:hypothetical protein
MSSLKLWMLNLSSKRKYFSEVSATWLNLSKCLPKIQIFLGMLFKLFRIYTSRLITLSQTLLGFGRQWQKGPLGAGRQRGKRWALEKAKATKTNVFCFLSSLPLQPPRQCLGPTCHLSTNTVSPLRACLSL